MNKLVVLATICLIGAHGDPDPQEREVNSLSSLKQQQPAPSWGIYGGMGGAQGFANPYMRLNFGQPQPTYGQPMGGAPYMPPPQPQPGFGMNAGINWNQGGYPQIGGSAGWYPYGVPDYSYPNNGIESSTTKPDYANDEADDDEEESTGVEVVENGNMNQNFGLNWNQPWQQNGMYQPGVPNWSQSYTPVGGSCYNKCRPSCSFRPPPPPQPQPMRPRPRPLPIRPQPPRPMPQPAKPNYGCRTQCRPMCNQTPSCGGGSQFNGNTMVCNRNRPQMQPYQQAMPQLKYDIYGNPYYVNEQRTTLPARVDKPVVAKSEEAEAVDSSEAVEEEEQT